MGERSAISWTKSTFNPVIGCTKVSPGCDRCYAEALDKRWGNERWGPGAPRTRTSPANWREPMKWNREAPKSEFAGRRGFWPVFCASLADVFDNEWPEGVREDLWNLIEATPNLRWNLLTKRIPNVMKMVPGRWVAHGFPPHVSIGATIVNQEEADRDLNKLLDVPAAMHWISYEPALGPVNWSDPLMQRVVTPKTAAARIDWIIIGGESGPQARVFPVSWARSLLSYCFQTNTAVFVKQLGSNPLIAPEDGFDPLVLKEHRAGSKWDDPAKWPAWLRVQEFPR